MYISALIASFRNHCLVFRELQ